MTSADLSLVLDWRNQPRVRENMFNKNLIRADEHADWFDRKTSDPLCRLMIFEADGEPRGFISFDSAHKGGIAQWGFYRSPASGKGYGYLLGLEALRYGFLDIGLHKICGRVIEHNVRSLRLHERLGFAQEGMLRDEHYDGKQYHNVACFGLLASEWRMRD